MDDHPVNRLSREFCRLTGLPPTLEETGEQGFELEGVRCALIHRPAVAPGVVFAYAAFGPLPGEDRERAMQVLLEQNFVTFAGKGPCFTLSPITQEVVYVEHFNAARTTAQELVDTFTFLSRKALEWRRTHFFEYSHPDSHIAATTA